MPSRHPLGVRRLRPSSKSADRDVCEGCLTLSRGLTETMAEAFALGVSDVPEDRCQAGVLILGNVAQYKGAPNPRGIGARARAGLLE